MHGKRCLRLTRSQKNVALLIQMGTAPKIPEVFHGISNKPMTKCEILQFFRQRLIIVHSSWTTDTLSISSSLKDNSALGCKSYESHISFDPETYPFGNHDCFILGYGLLHLLLKTIVEPLQVNKKYRKNTHISNPSMFYMSSSHSHGKISHRSPNIFQFFEVIPFDGHQIHLNLPRWVLGHLCSQHSDCDLPYWLNKTGVNIIPQLLGI